MATRFMYKALATASLGIALTLLLPAPTTASSASSDTAAAPLVDPPAAPSHCRSRLYRYEDSYGDVWTIRSVSWTDNSTNEDGFTLETWRSQPGGWVLDSSRNLAANSTAVGVDVGGNGYKFRVRAFNASGDSAWSNWAH